MGGGGEITVIVSHSVACTGHSECLYSTRQKNGDVFVSLHSVWVARGAHWYIFRYQPKPFRFRRRKHSTVPLPIAHCPCITYVNNWSVKKHSISQVSLIFLKSSRRFCNSRFVLLRSPNALLNCCSPIVVFYLTFAQQPLLPLLGPVFVYTRLMLCWGCLRHHSPIANLYCLSLLLLPVVWRYVKWLLPTVYYYYLDNTILHNLQMPYTNYVKLRILYFYHQGLKPYMIAKVLDNEGIHVSPLECTSSWSCTRQLDR